MCNVIAVLEALKGAFTQRNTKYNNLRQQYYRHLMLLVIVCFYSVVFIYRVILGLHLIYKFSESQSRIQYDREFLLHLQFEAESVRKPAGLHLLPEIIHNGVSGVNICGAFEFIFTFYIAR